jgi:hypothetical protein
MDALAPDFSHYWLAGQGSISSDTATTRGNGDETLSPSQKEALDALTERINAARSVV